MQLDFLQHNFNSTQNEKYLLLESLHLVAEASPAVFLLILPNQPAMEQKLEIMKQREIKWNVVLLFGEASVKALQKWQPGALVDERWHLALGNRLGASKFIVNLMQFYSLSSKHLHR